MTQVYLVTFLSLEASYDLQCDCLESIGEFPVKHLVTSFSSSG